MRRSRTQRGYIYIYRISAIIMAALVIASVFPTAALASSKTGTGMAEWALRAYNEGWKYEYGGSSAGAVDCSGLIRSYIGSGGGAKALLDASSSSGGISSLPRVHGLGLWCDGHAGVYVGKNDSGENMAVDARNSKVDVVYSAMNSRNYNPWVKWFKIKGVSYPTTGWESFNGKKYYYYKGEFVTGVFEVDGVKYDFGKSGALKGEAKESDEPKTTTAAPKKTTTTTAAAKKTKANASLKLGMSGDSVTKLQKRLIELGWLDAEATGYYGEKTAKAVKSFQKSASLTADGVAGAATQEKLYSSSAPKYKQETKKTTEKKTTTTTVKTTTTTEKIISMRMGMEGDNVKKLQARLIELGWLDSEVTGFYGEKTAIAVQKFQRKVKLPDDGVAGRITLEKLYAADAPTKPTTTTTTKKTTTTTTTTTTKKTTTTTTAEEKDKDKDGDGEEETTKKTTTTTTTKKTTKKTTASTSNTTAETTEPTEETEPSYVEPTNAYGEPLYEELSFGAQGEAVRAMTRKLSELGYYDHDISDYFGVFLRIAVMNFQLNCGLGVTGIADAETQELLYSAYAPYASEMLSDRDIYGDELDMDELDEEAEGTEQAVSESDSGEVQLADSAGLGAYATHSDIVSFIGKYGDSGELQTMGIFSYTPPVITVFRDGESYEVSDELDTALDNCVFY